jgi:hypothetical protein
MLLYDNWVSGKYFHGFYSINFSFSFAIFYKLCYDFIYFYIGFYLLIILPQFSFIKSYLNLLTKVWAVAV